MKSRCGSFHQQGVALLISVILLLIMTIVGVALVGGSVMQERMSANQRIQTLAFEAASAGVAEALNWGLNSDNWPASVTSCREGDRWLSDWSDDRPFGAAWYRLRVSCREDEVFRAVQGFEYEAAGERIPPQLFVLSEGWVSRADGAVASQRQIEVRIENRAGSDGNVDPAIRVEGETIAFRTANSGVFLVDGDGGPAMATAEERNRDAIENAIVDTGGGETGRLGNYVGGIREGVGQYPFGSADELARFAALIKQEMQADPTGCGRNFVSGSAQGGGNVPGCSVSNSTDLTSLPAGFNTGAVTYITGDVVIGPNLDGAGLLIVEGNVCWHGRADFRGQVIALGGLFEMRGGGNGRTEGALFFADLAPDLNPPSTLSWGNPELDFRGGGNHRVKYNCALIQQQAETLQNVCGLDLGWEPLCDEDGRRAPGIGERIMMTSWRENLGWREETLPGAGGDPDDDEE